MVRENSPDYDIINAAITVDNPVSQINNLAGMFDFDFRIELKDFTRGLTNDL